MVRAKFRVSCIQIQQGGSKSISLVPVTGGSKENEEFFKWTPTGSITLSTLNEKAAEQFEIDKEYYIDFTPAD